MSQSIHQPTAQQSIIAAYNLGKFGTPTTQWLLLSMLGLALLDGVVSGYGEARQLDLVWWNLPVLIVMVVLLLSWYHQDSNWHHYQRPKLLTIVIVAAAIIGIPYYLINSRSRGKKLIALAWLFVYILLLFLFSMCGTWLAQLLYS